MTAEVEPCPIPRCAMEWLLAAILLVMSLMTGVLGEGSAVLTALKIDGIFTDHELRFGWMILLLSAGLFQAGSLLGKHHMLQRWSAAWSSSVMAVMASLLWTSYPVPFEIAGISLVLLCGEIYIFLMLRGAKWSGNGGCNDGAN